MNKFFLILLIVITKFCVAQNVGIGTTAPATTLHVKSSSANPVIIDGGNSLFVTLAENGINRGYIGSYSGNAEDVELGTYSGNIGNVHLTTQNTPRLTVKYNGNVGIGTATPSISALLDISSNTKGFLLPRMTSTQRDAIPSPVAGLQIWCTDCKQLQVYSGSVWQAASIGTVYYPNVSICCQKWMTQNLDVTTYRNGDSIPKVTNDADWFSLTTGAYCYYENDSATYAATYGKLYNWYAVNDPRGLAPEGWRVPTHFEWTTLVDCLGGSTIAGGKLKEAGFAHWANPNTAVTNISGFTALPAGYRIERGDPLLPTFNMLGVYTRFWTATDGPPGQQPYVHFLYIGSGGSSVAGNFGKQDGCSVRCIKD
jgi:uncharacterized protein (TIGR02145 family)